MQKVRGVQEQAKPPIIVTRDSANALYAYAMEVSSGCDVNESLANFTKRKQRGLCAEWQRLRDYRHAQAIRFLSVHHHPPWMFPDPSLLSSVIPPPEPPGIAGLKINLSGFQGQVVYMLIPSGPVVIMAASFMNVTFARLPLDDDDDKISLAIQNQYSLNIRRYMNVLGYYGMPQNLLTHAGKLPPEMYPCANTRAMPKN